MIGCSVEPKCAGRVASGRLVAAADVAAVGNGAGAPNGPPSRGIRRSRSRSGPRPGSRRGGCTSQQPWSRLRGGSGIGPLSHSTTHWTGTVTARPEPDIPTDRAQSQGGVTCSSDSASPTASPSSRAPARASAPAARSPSPRREPTSPSPPAPRRQLDAVADQVRALGRRALVFPADVNDLDDARRLVAATVGEFGRLDIVVNNAGGVDARRPLLDTSVKTFEQAFHFNVTTAFALSKAALPHLLDRRSRVDRQHHVRDGAAPRPRVRRLRHRQGRAGAHDPAHGRRLRAPDPRQRDRGRFRSRRPHSRSC